MSFTAERIYIQEIIEVEAEVDTTPLLAMTRRPISIYNRCRANSHRITIQQVVTSLRHHRLSTPALRHILHTSEDLPEKRTTWISLLPFGTNGTSSCTRSIG